MVQRACAEGTGVAGKALSKEQDTPRGVCFIYLKQKSEIYILTALPP